MISFYKRIIFNNKGTFSLILILFLCFFLKSYLDLFATFIYGKINIIIFSLIFFIFGLFGFPTLPFSLLGYKLYGVLTCSIFTGLPVTLIILFQINFYNTLSLKISKDDYIKKISSKIESFSKFNKILIISLLRMNPVLPLHLISGVSRRILSQKDISYELFIIIIYLSSVICSIFLGLMFSFIEKL